MKHIKLILITAITMALFACSKSNINEEPETILSDISGVWSEYAYLCSDGYFRTFTIRDIICIMNLQDPIFSRNIH